MRIRPATLEDAAGINAVYNPYILETPATFETMPIDEPARRQEPAVLEGEDVVGGPPSRDYYRIADRRLRGAVEAARLEASDRATAAEHRARAEEARGELLRATEVLP